VRAVEREFIEAIPLSPIIFGEKFPHIAPDVASE
jgi:hypothetical protein